MTATIDDVHKTLTAQMAQAAQFRAEDAAAAVEKKRESDIATQKSLRNSISQRRFQIEEYSHDRFTTLQGFFGSAAKGFMGRNGHTQSMWPILTTAFSFIGILGQISRKGKSIAKTQDELDKDQAELDKFGQGTPTPNNTGNTPSAPGSPILSSAASRIAPGPVLSGLTP